MPFNTSSTIWTEYQQRGKETRLLMNGTTYKNCWLWRHFIEMLQSRFVLTGILLLEYRLPSSEDATKVLGTINRVHSFHYNGISYTRNRQKALVCTCNEVDRLCCLVVRFLGHIPTGPEIDSRRFQIFWVVVGLEQGPLSHVRIN
jgi:hypothetical protein